MKKVDQIPKRVLAWYARHQRQLPWRRTRDPYAVWVSEIMLQQTQVKTAIPYYHRFLDRFPTTEDLAKAPLQEVLKVWENLGYYSRARHLHEAASVVTNSPGGKIPDTLRELRRLPGIGEYTAAAIMSFAFNQKAATVDGNVRRVLSRVFAIREPLNRSPTQKRISDLAEKLVPDKDSSSFNQGLMDLGATICTARKPSCGLCPLNDLCGAFQKGLQQALPATGKRTPLPHREMTAALIRNGGGRILIVQREPRGLLGGLWKFPGGERAKTESLEDTLQKIVLKELGIWIKVGSALTSVNHAYTHFKMTLRAYQCTRVRGRPRPLGCARWKWVRARELSEYAFSRADRKIIEVL